MIYKLFTNLLVLVAALVMCVKQRGLCLNELKNMPTVAKRKMIKVQSLNICVLVHIVTIYGTYLI